MLAVKNGLTKRNGCGVILGEERVDLEKSLTRLDLRSGRAREADNHFDSNTAFDVTINIYHFFPLRAAMLTDKHRLREYVL